MGLDTKQNPILYSVGTHLAYKISKRYLEQITTGDRHTKEIESNITGILRGAKAKFDGGIINEKEYNEIRGIVSAAEYESFFPMLYN